MTSAPGGERIEDATRPRRARGLELTLVQQLPGQHLRAIHDVFRDDLRSLLDRVDEVRRGEATVADLRAAVNHLSGRHSEETLSGFCARFCSFVTLHHTLEDQSMLPAVAALPDYAPVAERLAEEHVVIHAHLVRIDAVLRRLDGGHDASRRAGDGSGRTGRGPALALHLRGDRAGRASRPAGDARLDPAAQLRAGPRELRSWCRAAAPVGTASSSSPSAHRATRSGITAPSRPLAR